MRWRALYGLALAVWAIGIPIAFSSRTLWGILWSSIGAFYLGLELLIRRTESPFPAAVSRVGTSALLFAVGIWRFGWDDILIFPLAAWQLAIAAGLVWLGLRER